MHGCDPPKSLLAKLASPIHDFPATDHALAAAKFDRRNQRHHMPPYVIRQIARISQFAACISGGFRSSTLAASPRVRPPPLNETRFSGSNFFPDKHFGNDRCAVACGNRGDAPWLPGKSVPRGATRINEIGMALEGAVAEASLARKPRRISPLDHDRFKMNRSWSLLFCFVA